VSTQRLAIVSPRFAPFVGGAETHAAEIAYRIAQNGWEVDVLTQEQDRALPTLEHTRGITIRRFPLLMPSQHYAIAPSLWSYLARFSQEYDVIHAVNYHALPALMVALTSRTPLVFSPHYHGAGSSRFRTMLHLPYRRLGAEILRRSRYVLCDTEAEAQLLGRDFPAIANRLSVVPLGVEVEAIREAAPYEGEDGVILCVGRLESYKNVQICIRALAHLDDTFVLRIIGDGPYRASLETLAASLSLQQRVTFLGKVDGHTLRRWLNTARVFVSMSQREAFGITFLEALAAGRCCAVSDLPAHRDIAALSNVTNSVQFIPPTASPLEVAQGIGHMAARDHHSDRQLRICSWADVAKQMLAIYESCLSSSAANAQRATAAAYGSTGTRAAMNHAQ